MHGLAVYVKGTLPFAQDLSLENSVDSYLHFGLALLHSVSYFFFLNIEHPFHIYARFFDSISSNINEVILINPSAKVFVFGDFNIHHKDWLTYSGVTNRLFLSQMTLLKWLTFLLGSLTDSHSPAFLDLFVSYNTSICSTMTFPPLGNSDHVVVSVSIDFPTNSKQDALFHCIAYDYSSADWDGLNDHLRDVSWENILKLSASATASEFCDWVQVGIDVYIPH